MRNQKGITLVALVITIIVLLILAGVSISLVIGQNGVLNQASNAVVTNKAAGVKEKVSTALASAETTYYSKWAQDSATTRADIYGDGAGGAVLTELTSVYGGSTNIKINGDLVGASTADNVLILSGSDLFAFTVSVNATTGVATIGENIKVYEGATSTTASGTPVTVKLK